MKKDKLSVLTKGQKQILIEHLYHYFTNPVYDIKKTTFIEKENKHNYYEKYISSNLNDREYSYSCCILIDLIQRLVYNDSNMKITLEDLHKLFPNYTKAVMKVLSKEKDYIPTLSSSFHHTKRVPFIIKFRNKYNKELISIL
jgi:hypothetical protein